VRIMLTPQGGNDTAMRGPPGSPHVPLERTVMNHQHFFDMIDSQDKLNGAATTLIVATLVPLFPENMTGPLNRPIRKAASNMRSATYAQATLTWAEGLAETVATSRATWNEEIDGPFTGVAQVKVINLWDAIVSSVRESGDSSKYTQWVSILSFSAILS
jgi:hypothetical protein